MRLRALLLQEIPSARNQAILKREVDTLLAWAPRLLDGEDFRSTLWWIICWRRFWSVGAPNSLCQCCQRCRTRCVRAERRETCSATNNLSHLLVNELGVEFKQETATSPNGQTAGYGAQRSGTVHCRHLAGRQPTWARQTVHGIAGVLPLLIALDGPEAVVTLACGVKQAGRGGVRHEG